MGSLNTRAAVISAEIADIASVNDFPLKGCPDWPSRHVAAAFLSPGLRDIFVRAISLLAQTRLLRCHPIGYVFLR